MSERIPGERILNIGCKNLREGTTNVDIEPSPITDCLCDAHTLPFLDKTFDKVIIRHCLEHCERPLDVLREAKRVAKTVVEIYIPNSHYHRRHQLSSQHLYGWSIVEFENLLSAVFPSLKVHGAFRFVERNRLKTVKTMLLALFYREKNELAAVCRVDP